MAITYPLAFPTVYPSECTWIARPVVAVSESPYTFSQQPQDWGGQRWELTFNFPAMRRERAELLYSLLLKLNGRCGTFLLGDPGSRTPRGSVAGDPVVNGASQTGNELSTSGWTPNASGVLLRGDYIQLGTGATSRLHYVLDDVDADENGRADLLFWPSLRESPTAASPIVTSNTVCRFRLSSNELARTVLPPILFSNMTVAAAEVI